jgi:hypothetical protein
MHAERLFPSELWPQIPAAVQDSMHALEARVTALAAAVQRWEATVQHLTERLPHDSRPSSRPSSSDPPQATAKRPGRDPSGRQAGGQPGHEGQARALVPVEAVDVVISGKPERCRRCPSPRQGEEAQPERHQVTARPPIKPVVTESQVHPLGGPACGEATRGELPVGVPSGAFGPRVHAITALCTGAYHVSTRTTQRGLEDLDGLPRSLGTRANLEQATVQALAEPVAEARADMCRGH